MAKGLPKKLLFETMLFEDKRGEEWIGAIASLQDRWGAIPGVYLLVTIFIH